MDHNIEALALRTTRRACVVWWQAILPEPCAVGMALSHSRDIME
jgi:hypothetical protein